MASATGDFKERDLGGIVDELFTVYRRNFLRFIGIIAVAGIPIAVVGTLYIWYLSAFLSDLVSLLIEGKQLEGTGELTVLLLLTAVMVVVSVLAGLLMAAAVAYAVAGHYLGNTVAIGRTYQFALRRLGSLVGAAFLAGLAIFAMGITIIGYPAAIYFNVTWAFIVQAIVLEGCGARKSLSRSSFLVKGAWWRVLGILIVLSLIGSILASVAGGIAGSIIGNFAGGLVGIIFMPISLIGATLLYFDLRIRKEGYSLQVMAQELGLADRLGNGQGGVKAGQIQGEMYNSKQSLLERRRAAMFCRNCGKGLTGTPEICRGCGAKSLAGANFCNGCGAPTTALTEICVKCGIRLAKAEERDISPKSRLVVTLLAWFVGHLGVHRFYLGKIGTGIAMLLTLGGFGIWTLIDFIFAVAGIMKDKEGKVIKKW